MRGASGLRTLLVLVLLFTMVSVVSSQELFKGIEGLDFQMENKIDIIQVGTILPMSVEGVVSVSSDFLKPMSVAYSENNEVLSTLINEMEMVSDIPTCLSDQNFYTITGAVYIGFEMDVSNGNNYKPLPMEVSWLAAGFI